MTLYVVVVLYNRGIAESPTCASLLEQDGPVGQDAILVYDNSASSKIESAPPGWQVHRDPTNGGLSTAYNFAIEQARARGCEWVLLLDQDTVLPHDYLAGIHVKILEMQACSHVVAIIPIIKVGDRQMSPMYPKIGRETPFERRNVVVAEWLAAINSGTCVRTDFIVELGGFCKEFPLDYLDFWLFRMISAKGRSVNVTNVELQHELSVANMNEVSVARYRRILAAELRFTNGYLPIGRKLIVVPRLLGRAVKHFLHTSDKRLALAMASAAITQLRYLCRFPSTKEAHDE